MIALPQIPSLLGFSAAAVLLILTPGPDMILFLGRTISQGRVGGFVSFAGVMAGLLVHTVLAAVGLSALLAASSVAFAALKYAGAAYLVFLAVRSLVAGTRLSGHFEAGVIPLRRAFWSAFWVNLLNPKIVLFFLTFLPQFVDPADSSAQGEIVFFGIWYVVLSLPISAVIILAAGQIAGLIRSSPRALRLFDYAVAGLFGAFAVRLALASRP